jgi:hypothetical protein
VSSNLISWLLFKQNHDDSHADHFKVKKTLDLLQRKYFWSAINQDVKEYVDYYETCHRVKIIKHKSFKQLQSILMLKKSRQDWTMNFITDLSSSKRWNKTNDSILIVIDRYTKYAKYIRARKNWTTVQLTNVLVKKLFIKLKISVFIITDRESLFIVNYWFVFCYHFKSALRYNTAFHSQTDEQTER